MSSLVGATAGGGGGGTALPSSVMDTTSVTPCVAAPGPTTVIPFGTVSADADMQQPITHKNRRYLRGGGFIVLPDQAST